MAKFICPHCSVITSNPGMSCAFCGKEFATALVAIADNPFLQKNKLLLLILGILTLSLAAGLTLYIQQNTRLSQPIQLSESTVLINTEQHEKIMSQPGARRLFYIQSILKGYDINCGVKNAHIQEGSIPLKWETTCRNNQHYYLQIRS